MDALKMLDIERHREALRQCSIAAALDTIGERWSFLILRGAFNGLKHFEEFQSTLGIARNILSNRLTRMVEHQILAREPDPSDRRKVSYPLKLFLRSHVPRPPPYAPKPVCGGGRIRVYRGDSPV
jgi:DNA-binding HxlR family transcriptional regulator